MTGPLKSRSFPGAAGLSVAVVLLCAVAVLALTRAGLHDSADEGVAINERHLPTSVNAPNAWSSEEYQRGPVAGIGYAPRRRIDGIFGHRDPLELFAISAVDGSASWLPLPEYSFDQWDLVSGFAVSPDGQWIGWVRPAPGNGVGGGKLAGWALMNTKTGRVRRLEDPNSSTLKTSYDNLEFSGDSRYLLTSYEAPSGRKRPKSRRDQLVAWDVGDGTPTVLEKPGHRWSPLLGSAPSGVVWSRGHEVFRADPVSVELTSVSLPNEVYEASWGPNATSFAYIGNSPTAKSSPRLYAGSTLSRARGRLVPLTSKIEVGQILGWVDPTHVVIGDYRTTVHVVNIETGDVRAIDMAGRGDRTSVPYLADGLWANPLVTPAPPDNATDPRRPWWWASGAVLISFAGVLLARRRRRGRVPGEPGEHESGVDPQRADPTEMMDPLVVQPQHYSAYDGHTAALRPLRRLSTAATGLVIVLLDFRIQGLDLIPDPIGWVMAAWALCSLRSLHRSFYVAGVAAWLAVIPALPDWVGVEGSLLTFTIALALVVVEVATCTALMAVSPARESTAFTIRWLTLGLSAALALTLVVTSVEPSALILAVLIGVADLVVTVWFLVVLYRVAKQSPAYGAEMLPV